MSITESILAGGKQVKGRASKTKWKQLSLALHMSFSVIFVKAGTRDIRRFSYTLFLYTHTKINEVTTVCSLRSLRLFALN